MTRVMIDTTHNGLPVALNAIRLLPAGNLVALYDTGSADIGATPEDINAIPKSQTIVFIDQGYTGSPNMKARVRDCENGAWLLNRAVDKTGWDVPRPTLYLGYPDTMQQAHDLGWRGDVWLVRPANIAPTAPTVVPEGLNVIGEQWNFANGAFDVSVIFDETWPEAIMTTPVPPVDPPATVALQNNWAWCNKCQGLFYGPNMAHSVCPAGGQHNGNGSFNYFLPDLHQ